MTTTHTTTVSPKGNEVFTLACTCGERVDYRGESFTQVEAQRHQVWHDKAGR